MSMQIDNNLKLVYLKKLDLRGTCICGYIQLNKTQFQRKYSQKRIHCRRNDKNQARFPKIYFLVCKQMYIAQKNLTHFYFEAIYFIGKLKL